MQGEAENGSIMTYKLTGTERADMKKLMDTYFIPYLKIKTNCTADANNNNCTKVDRMKRDGKTLDSWNTKSRAKINSFILDNGTLVSAFTSQTYQTVIAIDINGDNPPNRWGRDVFWFGISYKPTNNDYFRVGPPGLYPWGAGQSREYLLHTGSESCDKQNAAGTMCAALMLLDRKISKDYPW